MKSRHFPLWEEERGQGRANRFPLACEPWQLYNRKGVRFAFCRDESLAEKMMGAEESEDDGVRRGEITGTYRKELGSMEEVELSLCLKERGSGAEVRGMLSDSPYLDSFSALGNVSWNPRACATFVTR